MIRYLLILTLMMFCNLASADIRYRWDIPTQYADGNTLQVTAISHYEIEYITPQIPSPQIVKTTTGTETSLIVPDIWTATGRIRTVTKDGQQSVWSEPAICAPPATKMNLRCEIVQ